jgi:hypothetical protein
MCRRSINKAARGEIVAKPGDDEGDGRLSEQINPCEACARATPKEALQPFTTNERLRTFIGVRRDGGGAPLYETVHRPRTFQVCDACAQRLAAGVGLNAIRSRRVNRQMLLFAMLLILIALLTPILLPWVRSALWLS